MSDWFGILLTILSIFVGGFALGYRCGKEIGTTNTDVPNRNVWDIISRHEAIDAIWSHETAILEGLNCDVLIQDVYKMAHRHIVDVIKRLPSAPLIR